MGCTSSRRRDPDDSDAPLADILAGASTGGADSLKAQQDCEGPAGPTLDAPLTTASLVDSTVLAASDSSVEDTAHPAADSSTSIPQVLSTSILCFAVVHPAGPTVNLQLSLASLLHTVLFGSLYEYAISNS